MSILTNEQLKFYRENGYVLVKSLVNHDLINDVFAIVSKLLNKYGQHTIDTSRTFDSWEDNEFHQAMINLRSQSPTAFSAVYDSTRISYAVENLVHESNTLNCVTQILKQPSHGLCTRGSFVRMDPPHDHRSTYGWHQDSSYTDYNKHGDNAVVTWVPLTHNSSKNGTVKVCIGGSHKEGQIAVDAFRTGTDHVRQFPVPLSYIDKYKILDIDASPGDVLFIHMHLIHRSGENTSSQIRFTATTRFHSMLADDFVIKANR